MVQTRKILIADPDLDAVRGLSRALREKGYQVHYAPDGSKALEVAVLRHPDLTLFDEQCRLLEARTFIQILRTNPRTEDIPVVLTAANFDLDRMRGLRDGYLKKPFNLDEVLARIDHLFRRGEAAKNLKGEAHEIEGTLTQLSIPDLLQILSMNKRTGRLALTRGTDRGEIQVAEGRPVNARVGSVEGEKALFRLLTWSTGVFSFTPSQGGGPVRVARSMDDALLEAMRQGDEIQRLKPNLPGFDARVELSPDTELPPDQHPVTAQVVELLREPRSIADILDLAAAPDLDVLVVLQTLLQRRIARIAEGPEPGAAPLLSPAEVHALRARVARGRVGAQLVVGKIFVCANQPASARALVAQLPGLKTVGPDPAALKEMFGTFARYDVSDTLKLDFCVLPAPEAARPLWRPFCSGAVGALLLEDGAEATRLAGFFAYENRVPVVVVGPSVPPDLQSAPSGALAIAEGVPLALRQLLLQSLQAGGTYTPAEGSAA